MYRGCSPLPRSQEGVGVSGSTRSRGQLLARVSDGGMRIDSTNLCQIIIYEAFRNTTYYLGSSDDRIMNRECSGAWIASDKISLGCSCRKYFREYTVQERELFYLSIEKLVSGVWIKILQGTFTLNFESKLHCTQISLQNIILSTSKHSPYFVQGDVSVSRFRVRFLKIQHSVLFAVSILSKLALLLFSL